MRSSFLRGQCSGSPERRLHESPAHSCCDCGCLHLLASSASQSADGETELHAVLASMLALDFCHRWMNGSVSSDATERESLTLTRGFNLRFGRKGFLPL